jgi:hypothetical protein
MSYTFKAPIQLIIEPSLLNTLYPYPTEEALSLLRPIEARNLVGKIQRTRNVFLESASGKVFQNMITASRQGLEIAHQQVTIMGHLLAWSSRVLAGGKIEISICLGSENLNNRNFTEMDFRRAEEASYRAMKAREQQQKTRYRR